MLDSSPFRRPEHSYYEPRTVPGWLWGGLVGALLGILLGTGLGLLLSRAIWPAPQADPVAGRAVPVDLARDDEPRVKVEAKRVALSSRIDLMFVVDVTGSMEFPMRRIQDNLEEFVRRLRDDRLDVRVGLTVFRDGFIPDAGPGIMGDPWAFTFRDGGQYTSDASEVRDTLGRIRADGGGDGPENSFEGLRRAAEVPGRADAIKILILVTDAEPKPWPNYEDNLRATRTFLQDKNVRQCHVITLPAYRAVYEQLWNSARDPRTGRPLLGGLCFDQADNTMLSFDAIRARIAEETR